MCVVSFNKRIAKCSPTPLLLRGSSAGLLPVSRTSPTSPGGPHAQVSCGGAGVPALHAPGTLSSQFTHPYPIRDPVWSWGAVPADLCVSRSEGEGGRNMRGPPAAEAGEPRSTHCWQNLTPLNQAKLSPWLRDTSPRPPRGGKPAKCVLPIMGL